MYFWKMTKKHYYGFGMVRLVEFSAKSTYHIHTKTWSFNNPVQQLEALGGFISNVGGNLQKHV